MTEFLHNIIWLRPDSIGDNVLAASMLAHIKGKFPKYSITAVCQEHIAELYEICPFIDNVITLPTEHHWKDNAEYGYFLSRIKALKPEMLINSTYSLHAISDIQGLEFIPVRIAFRQGARSSYTHLLPKPGEWLPELQKHTMFLQGLGIYVDSLLPVVWLSANDVAWAQNMFLNCGFIPEKTIVVCPGARTHHRLYPVENYAEAIEKALHGEKFSVLVIGGTNDLKYTESLQSLLKIPCVNLSGKTTLRQIAALIQLARLYVGTETAAAHIACAVGKPNVVILGGGHFGRFMPYTPLTTIVCLPLDCYCCDWQCKYDQAYCITGISPSVISEGIKTALSAESESTRIVAQDESSWLPVLGLPHWNAPPTVSDASVIYFSPYKDRVTVNEFCAQHPHSIAEPYDRARKSVNISRTIGPRITVVTPSYNQAEYLEECIDSILSQNYSNLEYIIMDGGSTDGSVEIIKKYENHLSYWQSKPDGGQYTAINEGFRRSTGEIMAWLNSDDKYHPGALHLVDLAFRAMPQSDWITGRPTAWDNLGKLIIVFDHVPLWSQERLLYHGKDDYYIQQESTFWRRNLWDRAGGKIDTTWQLAADFELWCRFFHHSQLIGVDALLGGFRYHSGQKTSILMDRYEQEVLQIIDRERLPNGNLKVQSRPSSAVDMGEIISAITPKLTSDVFSYFTYSRIPHFNWFKASAKKLFGRAIHPDNCDLKMYQDLLCYTFIVDNLPRGSRILEVGGGDSRVLKALKYDYECWNIDKLEGLGSGLTNVTPDEYRMIKAYMGDFSKELPDRYFDFVFSISALEHVQENEENFNNICRDMDRIMKPGAFSLHCFDVIAKPDSVWTNSLLPFLFHRYETLNRFTPFEMMVRDPSLYCMSESAYNNGWKQTTQQNYQNFGKPLSYNVLWNKVSEESYDPAVISNDSEFISADKTNVSGHEPVRHIEDAQDTSQIVVATSIAPLNIDIQQQAIASWDQHGFKVISVNTASEIALLKEHFKSVTFVETSRDASLAFKKPLIYLDDILAALLSSGCRVCGIINADIHLMPNDHLAEFIRLRAVDSLVIGSRSDVNSLNEEPVDFFLNGRDYFFFDRSLISSFMGTSFCLGAPWWDIWLPFAAMAADVRPQQIQQKIAKHVRHEIRWDQNEGWNMCGQLFIEYMQRSNHSLRNDKQYIELESNFIHHGDGLPFAVFVTKYLMSATDWVSLEQRAVAEPAESISSSFPPTEILVSAIVSIYNAEQFIRGCIEDLESQTIADRLEIIIIDSASPQNEVAIVRELQGFYNNIRYLRTEQRETVYAAWNRGIALARGRYITNANVDDRHRSDAFELMTRVMESRPAVDLVYADVLITKTPNEAFDHHTLSGKYAWCDWDRNILLDRGCFIGPQPLWRRSLHELYGGFDPTYVTSGDYEFWLRISQTSDFFHIRQPLGLYLAHPDSIEHRNEDRKGSENSKILNLYRQAAKEGRVVGLIPLQQLGELAADGMRGRPRAEITALVDVLETRLISRAALSGNRIGSYHLAKTRLLECAEPGTLQIEEYLNCAVPLILGGMEWHTNRRSVEDTTKDEFLLRLELLSMALQKARLFFQRGDVDKAVSMLLEQGIKAAPLSPVAYFELTEILMSAGRHADALQVLPEMPPSANASRMHEVQAICFSALGHDEEASQAALKALGRPRSLVVMGTLAARSGNLAAAHSFFQQAIDADHSCGSAWLSQGMLLWGNGEQDRAYQAVRRAVEVDPLNDDAVRILRDMAERNNSCADAFQIISEASQLYPDSRNLGRHHAELLSRCGRDQEALGACEAFLARFGADDAVLALARHLRSRTGMHDCLVGPGTQSISLCMIVKNEEKYLPACLASLKPVVDEIIVVDTGSTDRTADIATAFGARVCNFRWNGNFSDARNYSIAQAKGEWVLVMDADEVISASDYNALRLAVREGGQHVAWNILTRNYTNRHAHGWNANDGAYASEERGCGWHPSRKVRLFPNDERIRFRGEVHELVEASAEESGYTIRDASVIVHHYGELAEQQGDKTSKQLVYFQLGKDKLAENPDDLIAIGELAVQAGELKLFDEAIELWDRFLALKPDAPVALFNRGFALMGLGRYGEALEMARRALKAEPFHKEAAFNFGTCALYAGDAREAISYLETVLKQHPEHPPLLSLLVVLYLVTGQQEQAGLAVGKLQQLNYNIADYIRDRALILDSLGRTEMARQLRTGSFTLGFSGL
jgi:glycosyltransferase involved in cell wall biosynthesis/ADP-heptose:LPS heptosyltransferase/lipopolysaccharide biosynthesis regulator YciM/ubiquinone/menaquinone biosynthesis C-methylase UbiE